MRSRLIGCLILIVVAMLEIAIVSDNAQRVSFMRACSKEQTIETCQATWMQGEAEWYSR